MVKSFQTKDLFPAKPLHLTFGEIHLEQLTQYKAFFHIEQKTTFSDQRNNVNRNRGNPLEGENDRKVRLKIQDLRFNVWGECDNSQKTKI